MRAGKANAIGTAFLDRLSAQLDAVESSGASALVLTGEGTAFSAGLDLPEVAGLDRARLERFIRRFSEVMLRVFTLPVPVVAAINGHAIAGGCVLAMQADVRLAAAGDYRIGLNEVQIGLGLPAVVVETLRAQVSPASLGPVALEGRPRPEEARARARTAGPSSAQAAARRWSATCRRCTSTACGRRCRTPTHEDAGMSGFTRHRRSGASSGRTHGSGWRPRSARPPASGWARWCAA